MKTIRISDEVWNEIAKKGKFGETPDDVLRRVFKIIEEPSSELKPSRNRYATKRMSSKVVDGYLLVAFADGASNKWALPPKEDKLGIRKVRSDAIEFAERNGATQGQVDAVIKALTSTGYHLRK